MITKIRSGVFETNSSSTHTCVLMSKDDYAHWANGESYYVAYPPDTEPWKSLMTENGFIYKDKLKASKAKIAWDEDTYLNLYDVLQDIEVWVDEGDDMEADQFTCPQFKQWCEEDGDVYFMDDFVADLDVYSYHHFRRRFGESNGEGLEDETTRMINGTEVIALCTVQRD